MGFVQRNAPLLFVGGTIAAAVGVAVFVGKEQNIAGIVSYLTAFIVSAYALVVLWKIATDKIDLKDLLEEDTGGASLARFQMLIFTFVIALGYFLFIIKALSATPVKFPDLSDTALILIGISGGTYLLAKGIQKAGPAEAEPPKDANAGTRVNTNANSQ